MKELNEILKELKEKQKIISIFSNIEQLSSCAVGSIVDMDNDFIALKHVSPNGDEDGYVLRKITNIFRIDYEGQYEKKIEKIQKKEGCDEKKYDDSLSVIKKYLNFSLNEEKMIAIGILNDDEDICGVVENITNELVTVKKYNDFGVYDGISIIYLSDIEKLNCDTIELKNIAKIII